MSLLFHHNWDENDDAGGSWLDAILCGALSSAAPARPDRRRSAPL